MQVFEPATRDYDDQALADSIEDLDPWLHDGLPTYDINENSNLVDGDSGDVIRERAQTKTATTTTQPTFPRIVTAAQLAEEQASLTSNIRLHPERYEIGMDVEHPEYGIGTITGLSGEGQKRTATIDFPKLGKKRFRLAFCNLRMVE
jgi:DNA helicase-2/ATP-dependent DNA helicase PcrA